MVTIISWCYILITIFLQQPNSTIALDLCSSSAQVPENKVTMPVPWLGFGRVWLLPNYRCTYVWLVYGIIAISPWQNDRERFLYCCLYMLHHDYVIITNANAKRLLKFVNTLYLQYTNFGPFTSSKRYALCSVERKSIFSMHKEGAVNYFLQWMSTIIGQIIRALEV